MIKKKFVIAAAVIFSLFQFSESYSQNGDLLNKNKSIYNLTEEFLNTNVTKDKVTLNTTQATSQKSPALALLLSVILPGAGHFYIDRMDVGKYFFGIDVASWIGYATLDVYGNNVNDDAVTYSVQHAEVTNPDNKDDDYFTNVGSFNNIYEYNDDQLQRGQYGSLYDVNQYYWDWDNVENRNIFESQRKSGERILNTRIVFSSLLIANRVVCGISAYLLTNKPKSKTSSLNIEPEFLYKDDYSFDGVKINLSKNF